MSDLPPARVERVTERESESDLAERRERNRRPKAVDKARQKEQQGETVEIPAPETHDLDELA